MIMYGPNKRIDINYKRLSYGTFMQGLVKEVCFEPLTGSVLFLPILISLLGFMRSIDGPPEIYSR